MAEARELLIKLTVDAAQADKRLKDVQESVKGLDKSMQGASKSTRSTEAALTTLPAKLAEVKARMEELRRAGQTGGAQWQVLSAEMRRLTDENNKVSASLRGSAEGFRNVRGAVQNASYQVTDFFVQISSGTSATRALTQQLPQLLGGFGAVGAAMGLISVFAAPAVVSAFQKIYPPVKSLKEAMADAEKSTFDLNASFTKVNFTPVITAFNEGDAAMRRNILTMIDAELHLKELTLSTLELARTNAVLDGVGVGFFDKLSAIKATGLGLADNFEAMQKKLGLSAAQAATVATQLKFADSAGELTVQRAAALQKVLAKGNAEAKALGIEYFKAAFAAARLKTETGELAKLQERAAAALKSGGKIQTPVDLKKATSELEKFDKMLADIDTATDNLVSGEDGLSKLDDINNKIANGVLKLNEQQRDQIRNAAALYDETKRYIDLRKEAWSFVGKSEDDEAKKRSDAIVSETNAMRAQIEALEDAANPMRVYMRGQADLYTLWRTGWLSADGLAAGMARLDDALTKSSESLAGIQKPAQESGDLMERLKDSIDGYAKDMAGAFVKAIAAGEGFKETFKNITASFLQNIAQMILQVKVIEPMLKSLKASMNATGAAGGGGFWSSVLGGLSGLFGSAHGNAFAGATGLPHGVYNQPTFFNMPGNGPLQKFARGGVLGEAGPEAILPLRRGAGGKLGVDAAPVNVNVINNAGVNVGVEKDGNDINITIERVRNALTRDIRAGGNAFAGALQNTYGLNRANA